MRTTNSLLLLGVALLALANPARSAAPLPSVFFEWFEYTGDDTHFAAPLPPGSYRNPILAGCYPDPSICRAGDDYYLVNSSFVYYPGIPIFHSRDLVHWTQLGGVLSRPPQLKVAGLGVSRGVFAPAITHHDGVFYVINTLVDAGGNFFVTAKDPAGPWSDPVWLPEIDGIDPSFFFDDDGRAYIVNNGPPLENPPLYQGHRAIWMQEFDQRTQKLTGPREIIVNGGVDLAKHPIWIEAPHLIKKDGWYYLICAEGGTAEGHSEVVFRSRAVRGPYVPWNQNPILTQRTLDPKRSDPITCTGHADFVETPDGAWWTVFLGCRPYEGNLYNTGRETFLLPVKWTDDGWPMILQPGLTVPAIVAAPRLPAAPAPAIPTTGSFTWRDEFDGPTLQPVWNLLRTPHESWFSFTEKPGALALQPRAATLGGQDNPSLLVHPQQHANFAATAAVRVPTVAGESAGLVAFQNETHYFFLGLRRADAGLQLFLERSVASDHGGAPQTIATAEVPAPAAGLVYLKIAAAGRPYSFAYATAPDAWQTLKADVDGSILSTAVAGGFVGAYVGPYARVEP
jgi:alpha-N-arabinofuranosidase